jgi:hypothetical protein
LRRAPSQAARAGGSSGEGGGDTHYDGEVRVNSVRKRGNVDGLVEMTIGGQYSGALATAVVP